MRKQITQERARSLRVNCTEAERHLWQHLRARQVAGAKFRRQVPIGKFIGDFVCLDLGIVVEIDGSQHQERSPYDRRRAQELEQQGFWVLRFWNNEVLQQTTEVMEVIWTTVKDVQIARV
jgi:very-short-patch-repair endonuclease